MRKLFLLPVVALAACGSHDSPSVGSAQTASAIQKVELQLGSPDQAVKTWWRIRDFAEAESKANCEKLPRGDELRSTKYERAIYTGTALADLEPPPRTCSADSYNREIIEVKVESETRAIVLAHLKPTTPLPAGVTLTVGQAKDREEGTRYRYILEKVGKEWKIAQMYRYAEYRDDLWEPVFGEPLQPTPHYFVVGAQ